MIVDAVIPARLGSTRFPGKALARIAGKTMIERVYRRVEKADCFRRIIVATDHESIFREVEDFGGLCRMTSAAHRSGTDRIHEAVTEDPPDAVVNIQGDEPLIQPRLISRVTRALLNRDAQVITAAYASSSLQDFQSPHVVKVVFDGRRRALYFSRSPVPWIDLNERNIVFFQHVGIYAMRIDALNRFVNTTPGPLEIRERLEQLRFLENGLSIHVVESEETSHGVDVPEDVVRIEALLRGDT